MLNKKKAIALLSGGLDSSLAALLVKEQGIEVTGLFVKTPFNGMIPVAYLSEKLGQTVQVIEADEEYEALIKGPKFGYGRRANPCIDCHLYFLKKARELMVRAGAYFLVTGDVVGQRNMSQRLPVLSMIDRELAMSGFIVRPLSAQLLPPTVPEQEQVVARSRFLAISGRSRKEQLLLAGQYCLERYTAPSASCLLTDPLFERRLREAFKYNDIPFKDFALLRTGRHFRMDGYRFIVGRDAGENEALFDYGRKGIVVRIEDIPSPTGIFLEEDAAVSESVMRRAAEIVGAYSDAVRMGRQTVTVTVSIANAAGQRQEVVVKDKASFREWMI